MRAQNLGISFLALSFLFLTASAVRECHQCRGINCQRTTYNGTEKCVDEMDICANVYEGQILQAQGCLQQLPLDLRGKCNRESGDDENAPSECYKCLSSLCNNVGPSGYECIQCDSNEDNLCRSDASKLVPTKCPVSRANNMFCFVRDDGKRTVRGCVGGVKEQKDCLGESDCMLCSPGDISGCNVVQIKDSNDSGNGGDGNGGGNGNGGDNGGNGNGNGGDNGSGGGDGGNGNGGDNGNGGGDGGNGNGGGDGGNGNGGGDGGNGNGGGDNGNGGNGNGGGNGGNSAHIFSLSLSTIITCFACLLLRKSYS